MAKIYIATKFRFDIFDPIECCLVFVSKSDFLGLRKGARPLSQYKF